MSKNHIYKKEGWPEINTLSPNQQFFYKISEPQEVQWGIWICKVALFTTQNKSLYYRQGYFANLMPNTNIVKWSSDGRFALFNEFLLNKLCDYVIIDLSLEICYRVRWTKQTEAFWNGLEDRKYNSTEVLSHLYKEKIFPESTFKDKLQLTQFAGLVKNKMWLP